MAGKVFKTIGVLYRTKVVTVENVKQFIESSSISSYIEHKCSFNNIRVVTYQAEKNFLYFLLTFSMKFLTDKSTHVYFENFTYSTKNYK